jgi:hypothetical protein
MMTEASTAFSKTDNRKQRKALRSFCNRWRSAEPRAIQCFEHHLDRKITGRSAYPTRKSTLFLTVSGFSKG